MVLATLQEAWQNPPRCNTQWKYISANFSFFPTLLWSCPLANLFLCPRCFYCTKKQHQLCSRKFPITLSTSEQNYIIMQKIFDYKSQHTSKIHLKYFETPKFRLKAWSLAHQSALLLHSYLKGAADKLPMWPSGLKPTLGQTFFLSPQWTHRPSAGQEETWKRFPFAGTSWPKQ